MKHKMTLLLYILLCVMFVSFIVVYSQLRNANQSLLEVTKELEKEEVSYSEFTKKFDIFQKCLQKYFDTIRLDNYFYSTPDAFIFENENNLGALNGNILEPTRIMLRLKDKNKEFSNIDTYVTAFYVPEINCRRYIGGITYGSNAENVTNEDFRDFMGQYPVEGRFWIVDGMVLFFQNIGVEAKEIPLEYNTMLTNAFKDFKVELSKDIEIK